MLASRFLRWLSTQPYEPSSLARGKARAIRAALACAPLERAAVRVAAQIDLGEARHRLEGLRAGAWVAARGPRTPRCTAGGAPAPTPGAVAQPARYTTELRQPDAATSMGALLRAVTQVWPVEAPAPAEEARPPKRARRVTEDDLPSPQNLGCTQRITWNDYKNDQIRIPRAVKTKIPVHNGTVLLRVFGVIRECKCRQMDGERSGILKVFYVEYPIWGFNQLADLRFVVRSVPCPAEWDHSPHSHVLDLDDEGRLEYISM